MKRVKILSGFWHDRLEINASSAIFHQWRQLTASGCIENFRIAAGEAQGFREGWFFADSDAYKWLEAAARIWAERPDTRLAVLMDGLIALLGRAQMPDGYLFTYNQIHFPGTRWQNLQVEHELYCHGHLIEAGVSHYRATGRTDLLDIARRAADRITADFLGQSAASTPGHEEIELALLRLHQITPGDSVYLEMARQFIERRGRIPLFGLSILRQNSSMGQRRKMIQQQRRAYLAAHPEYKPFHLPPDNISVKPPFSSLRRLASGLSGKYLQQHAPVRRQTVPVGHSVRFGYLETGVALLARESGDRTLLPALERAWERMVTRRMYITGGLGSQPGLEGFGNDYELDPKSAYAETCAALASLFWNWEMVQLTGKARYSDLFEWQLYNAAVVGMGLDGTTYLYNNPLACEGGVIRQPWYAVPCCPSNLSRTWANLGSYIYSSAPGQLCVHQYISSALPAADVRGTDGEEIPLGIAMQSDLPWEGRVRLSITALDPAQPPQPAQMEILLRQPAWARGMHVSINGVPAQGRAAPHVDVPDATASGYDPRLAQFQTFQQVWHAGDEIEVNFDLPMMLRRAHPRVRGHGGKVALTRGPLVYCLEWIDNPDVDIFSARLDPDSLAVVYDQNLLGGINRIEAKTRQGDRLTFIPYFLWGNRGPARMTVWVNE